MQGPILPARIISQTPSALLTGASPCPLPNRDSANFSHNSNQDSSARPPPAASSRASVHKAINSLLCLLPHHNLGFIIIIIIIITTVVVVVVVVFSVQRKPDLAVSAAKATGSLSVAIGGYLEAQTPPNSTRRARVALEPFSFTFPRDPLADRYPRRQGPKEQEKQEREKRRRAASTTCLSSQQSIHPTDLGTFSSP